MVDFRILPTDLNTLKEWWGYAQEDDDQEMMSTLDKRIRMVESSQHDYQTPEELSDGPVDRFLIGAGRGLMDIGQGVKQKALMAFGDEGEADQYTQQVNQEVQQFEEDFPGIGAESAGRLAGWAAPGLVSGMAGGAIPAMVAGGLEGGVMATPNADWGQAATGAALGTAGAAAGAAIPGAVRGARNLARGKPIDPDLAQLVKETGVKLTPDQMKSTHLTRAGEKVFPQRGNKMAEIETALSRMQMKHATGDKLQPAYVEGANKLREADSLAWKEMWSEPVLPGEDSIRIGQIPVDEQDLVRRLVGTAETPKERQALMELGQHLPIRNQDGLDLEGLHQFRSNFAANKTGWEDAGLSKSTQKKIYAAMSREMRETAERGGGQRAASMMNRRIANSQEMYDLFDKTRLPKKIASGDVTSEETFSRIMRGGDSDRISALNQIMGEQGIPGTRNTVMETVLKATGPDLKTGKGVAAIDRLMPAIEEVLPADDVATMRGLRKLLAMAPGKGSQLEGILRGGGMMGAVAGAMTNPVAAGAGAMGLGALRYAMRRRDVQAMLQKLSTAEAGSPLQDALIDEIQNVIAAGSAGAAAQSDPMQIDIRNGRTP